MRPRDPIVGLCGTLTDIGNTYEGAYEKANGV